MHYQYNHCNQPKYVSYTVCVATPSKDYLEQMLEPFTKKSIVLGVGYSRVHPTDNYCKKTGREKSKERVKPILYNLLLVEYKNNECTLCFYSDSIDSPVSKLEFVLRERAEKPYFTFATLRLL